MTLTFRRDSLQSPESRHRDHAITGETYTEIVDKWNAGPWHWDLGPQEFREKLADFGGDRVEWTATDEELVLAVVEEANASKFSDGMRLEGAERGG